ncbi:MAG: restriction endonuclease [Puniceicoccaceae bacterium]|nr:MAG: restriction endonuclease [Puniceicoccaceae bacterium]
MELTASYEGAIPQGILSKYQFCEVRNAAAILNATSPRLWEEILSVLDGFSLSKEDICAAGGNKSDIAARLDEAFRELGWREGRVDTLIQLKVATSPYRKVGEEKGIIVESIVENKGYKVDNFKGRVALDVEWNAKDGNLDRDVGVYRALYDAAVIDAAVLITRTQTDLRDLAVRLDAESTKFATTTTTNLNKLLPRLTRGDGGGCPILAIAISAQTVEM